MEGLLGDVLSFKLRIVNPFLYRTKAECVTGLVSRYRDLLPLSVSCWKSSRQVLPHCGECVPCLVRRIALEYNDVFLAEYQRDLLNLDIGSLPVSDTGKVNLIELGEFIVWFGGGFPDAKLLETFPELYSENFDAAEAIQMYRRFAIEARTVLDRYPGVRGVLS
jgi:hypothetical protein